MLVLPSKLAIYLARVVAAVERDYTAPMLESLTVSWRRGIEAWQHGSASSSLAFRAAWCMVLQQGSWDASGGCTVLSGISMKKVDQHEETENQADAFA